MLSYCVVYSVLVVYKQTQGSPSIGAYRTSAVRTASRDQQTIQAIIAKGDASAVSAARRTGVVPVREGGPTGPKMEGGTLRLAR